jgi:YidC/Oxa1 family membrane protein insertase
MDQKRLIAAIALSIGILLMFDVWNRTQNPVPIPAPRVTTQGEVPLPTLPSLPGATAAAPNAAPTAVTAAVPAQRVAVSNGRIEGGISARGLMLDTLVLRGYRETIQPSSPLVTLLAPRGTPEGYFAQWGWTAADGRTAVPNNDTDWTFRVGR